MTRASTPPVGPFKRGEPFTDSSHGALTFSHLLAGSALRVPMASAHAVAVSVVLAALGRLTWAHELYAAFSLHEDRKRKHASGFSAFPVTCLPGELWRCKQAVADLS